MIAAWLLGAAVWAAAGDPPDQPVIPIEGSAWRLGQPHATPDPDLYSLVVLRDRQDCINAVGVDPVDVNACLPWINSATRQIHVAFQMRDGGSHIKPLALSANRFAVSYGARLGPVQVPTSQIQLVPHVPGDSNQLFVLLIDRSASMYEGSDHRPLIAELAILP